VSRSWSSACEAVGRLRRAADPTMREAEVFPERDHVASTESLGVEDGKSRGAPRKAGPRVDEDEGPAVCRQTSERAVLGDRGNREPAVDEARAAHLPAVLRDGGDERVPAGPGARRSAATRCGARTPARLRSTPSTGRPSTRAVLADVAPTRTVRMRCEEAGSHAPIRWLPARGPYDAGRYGLARKRPERRRA
jgi:hypothetical protein